MAFDLIQYAKRVAVRRIVYVLVALLLATCGIGRAEAAAPVNMCTASSPATCSKQQAYEGCKALSDWDGINVPSLADPARRKCTDTTVLWKYEVNSGGGWTTKQQYRYYGCPDGGVWNDTAKKCEADCSNKADKGPGGWGGVNETNMEVCFEGCLYAGTGSCIGGSLDGESQWICNAWNSKDQACPQGMSEGAPSPSDGDGDGTSDGGDSAPNNPGEGGGGPDGQADQDGSQGNGTNGSGPNGGQGNGSGEGSGNGNTAGGGGNCSTPPNVTGDAALAMIAYQTWATRCAVEKAGGTGQGEGEGDGEGEPTDNSAVSFNEGEEAEADGEEVEDSVTEHTFDIESMLDFSGFAGGGGCPDFGSINMGRFGTHSLGGQWFCDWLPVFRALIILMACGTAIKILLGYNA